MDAFEAEEGEGFAKLADGAATHSGGEMLLEVEEDVGCGEAVGLFSLEWKAEAAEEDVVLGLLGELVEAEVVVGCEVLPNLTHQGDFLGREG